MNSIRKVLYVISHFTTNGVAFTNFPNQLKRNRIIIINDIYYINDSKWKTFKMELLVVIQMQMNTENNLYIYTMNLFLYLIIPRKYLLCEVTLGVNQHWEGPNSIFHEIR